MFYLYHHQDSARLAALLATLGDRLRAGPLAAVTVLVPNQGLGRWLKLQIAETLGISANIRTELPAPYFWRLLAGSLPEGRADSAIYQREPLRWALYAYLPELAERIPAVAGYLADAGGERGRWQLADQLADIFDQYLIYRRDLLEAWEAGAVETASPADWQAALWRALVGKLGNRHRARLLAELIGRIERNEPVDTDHWPETLYCFGLDNLPPDYLRLLYAVGRRRDVHFLMTGLTDGYWGDIQKQPVALSLAQDSAGQPGEDRVDAGHPLLASLGFAARDFLRLLYSDEFRDIRELELGEFLEYQAPGDATLLQRLQSGIVRMDATPQIPGVADDDQSLQIHACHSPLREVQVLHDQLLDRLSADPTLEPRHIQVLVPRLADYAPAISAVFGGASGALRIPFSLSDRPRAHGHPLIPAFRSLLDLPLWRWTLDELLTLAALPAVMRRFGWDEADLERLRHWLAAAGVRWGWDAKDRERAGAGHWAQNSWEAGLDRLLAGLALADEETLIDGVAPWSDLEGGSAAALGQLCDLLARLRYWRARLPVEASATEWRTRLNRLLQDLFAPDPDDADERRALNSLHDAFAVLDGAHTAIRNAPISREALQAALDEALDSPAQRQPLWSGGVTFAGLTTGRVVPARVVCLLGMNDGAFPRADRQRSLNLIRRAPRLGDRNPADDDRLLLLQWLLAARDGFYVSYQGQDARGGERLEPSTAIGELLDFIAAWHFPDEPRAAALTRLVTTQPMQPFGPQYFAGAAQDPRIFTFQRDWQPAGRALLGPRRPALPFIDDGRLLPDTPGRVGQQTPDVAGSVDLADLQAFFQHPSRACLRDRLLLDLRALDPELPDSEPRTLDPLTRQRLRTALFDAAPNPESLGEEPSPLLRARGELPPPPIDVDAYRDLVQPLPVLLRIRDAWHTSGEAAAPCPLEIDLDPDTRLTGQLTEVWPEGLRVIRTGALRGDHLLRHWIALLALAASGAPATLRICGVDDGKLDAWMVRVEPEPARGHLRDLIEVFRDGRERPLCFLPTLGWSFVKPQFGSKPKSADQALDRCREYLTGTRAWEAADPWFRLHFGTAEIPLGETADTSAFCALSMRILQPLAEHLAPIDLAAMMAPSAGPGASR